MLWQATLAADGTIINPRPHSREVRSVLGAPGREEQASAGGGTSAGAISAALLARGHDVIHIAIVRAGPPSGALANGAYL